MITLALQIFLLLLSAYLLGCMLGCLLRRSFYNARRASEAEFEPVAAVAEPVLAPAVPTGDAARFERALTGGDASVTVRRDPVVEVRPRASVPVAPPPPSAKAPAPGPDRPEPAEIEIIKTPPPAPPPPPAATEPPEPAAPEPVAQEPVAPAVSEASSSAATIASYAAIAAASAAAAGATGEKQSEPQPPAPEPEPTPVVSEEPKPAPPPVAVASPAVPSEPLPADDLKRIRAIDRILEGRLNGLGVRRFAEISGWTAGDVALMNQSLGFTGGRIEQENWIEQAQILARGGDTDYSRNQRVNQSTAAAGIAAAAAGAAASQAAHRASGPDRLTRIIGIDPETEQALYAMGVSRYSQIAQWTSADIERVERELNRPGRVGLDNWVEQARILARYAGETESPRPVRLAEAIRENRDAASRPAYESRNEQRSDLVGLRSVRSEALRGEGVSPGQRVDDLKRIRGIGVLIEKRLNALGVASYEQIANWTGADIDRISTTLDFKGRIERENWVEQARILASGGQTEFSRRVDRGEVDSSRES